MTALSEEDARKLSAEIEAYRAQMDRLQAHIDDLSKGVDEAEQAIDASKSQVVTLVELLGIPLPQWLKEYL